jgi:hypothetical protein
LFSSVKETIFIFHPRSLKTEEIYESIADEISKSLVYCGDTKITISKFSIILVVLGIEEGCRNWALAATKAVPENIAIRASTSPVRNIVFFISPHTSRWLYSYYIHI